jgi:hypothetical protein
MSLSPLTRVNFKLLGGWRMNALIAPGYMALIVLIAVAVYRNAAPRDHALVSRSFLTLVAAAQGLFVVFVATGGIRKAVLRDFQTGMIESHRLTPLSGLQLVFGYLTGPTSQALLLYGGGLLLGSGFAWMYGKAMGFPGVFVSGWYFSQLCLLTLALMIWTLSLLIALVTAGKANIVILLVILGMVGGWMAVAFVPGVTLLTGVMSGGVLLNMMGVTGIVSQDPAATVWAMVLQVAYAAVFIAAAARKIRAPDRAVFGIPLGLILVALTGVTLVVGWRLFGAFAWMFGASSTHAAQWVASTFTLLIVAMLAINAAAAHRFRRDRVAALTAQRVAPFLRLVDLLPVVLAVMATVVMLMMLPTEVRDRIRAYGRGVLVPPIVACAVVLWIDYMLSYLFLVRGWRMFVGLLIGWLVLRGVPLVIQGALAIAREILQQGGEMNWHVASYSPVGTLILAATDTPGRGGDPWYGLSVQVLTAVIVTIAAYRARRRLAPTRRASG